MTSTTAAQTITHASQPDDVLREARERHAAGSAERRERAGLAALGLLVLVGIVAVAATVHAGPHFTLWRFLVYALVYSIVWRVEFEVGSGAAIPTQLVLVPMLFTLHLAAVPIAVLLGIFLRTLPDGTALLRSPRRALAFVANAAHSLGPVLVLALAHGLPLRWSAWPVYVAALAAQFGFDFVNAALNGAITGVDVRAVARYAGLAYLVDSALAPVGLLLAFATTKHPLLVVLVLPLVGLLRYFATERRQRIDSALELSDAYRGTAFLLGDVVEADDAYTGSHSRHVVDLVLGVADILGLSPADRRDAEFAALLHDVGKIRIPSEIINKPGPLDDAERELMNTHTIEGEKMLERVGGLIGHVGHLVRSCHERWDGAGYPDGLAGEEIPLIARIVCACDAYSAMTTDRSYRKARTKDEALDELERCAGSHFDPDVVSAIVALER